MEFIQVDGQKLTDKIEHGSVLDCFGSNYWKSTQMSKLIELLHNGTVTDADTLLFADLWSPGIEMLQYIKCIMGSGPKITGILHAGTYDPNDFTVRAGMRPFFHNIEFAWMQMIDKIFVATAYHKNLILNSHAVDPDKIKVTGLPLPFQGNELDKFQQIKDDRYVIFPHRMDPEKNPEEFSDMIGLLRQRVGYFPVCMTTTRPRTKGEYYTELGKASIAVSMADQETFGYAMLEATALGCVPLVPDRLSYREMYPEELRYKSYSNLYSILCMLLESDQELTRYRCITRDLANRHRAMYTESIGNMLKEVKHGSRSKEG